MRNLLIKIGLWFHTVIMTLAGLCLFLFPQAFGPLWPWMLPPLAARFMASLFLGGAVCTALAALAPGRIAPTSFEHDAAVLDLRTIQQHVGIDGLDTPAISNEKEMKKPGQPALVGIKEKLTPQPDPIDQVGMKQQLVQNVAPLAAQNVAQQAMAGAAGAPAGAFVSRMA